MQYTVATPADAPTSLTYGPSFFTLAGQLKGDVTIGLNRQLNNITNTGAAAVRAVQDVPGLLALELGNEPECAQPTVWLFALVAFTDTSSLRKRFTNNS